MNLTYFLIGLLPGLVASMDSYTLGTCVICDCNNETHLVDCSGQNMTHIPADPTGQTALLNMSSNNLGRINDSAFVTYTNLIELDISLAGIDELSQNAFRGLSSLHILDLSMNEQLPFTATNIPINIFESLNSLKELKVFGNTAAYANHGELYPDEALAKLQSLNELWIDGLGNTSFGVEFRNMTILETIRLPGDLTTIGRFCYTPSVSLDMLENLIHVKNFAMRRCGIRYVERNAFSKMIQLRELDLSLNYMLSMNDITNACEGLSQTRLESLLINYVGSSWGSCGLYISKNMTEMLGKLKYLKAIHVQRNEIIGFEKGALALVPKTLEYINAKMNFFEFGIYAFETFHLINLNKIDLSYNQFPDPAAIWHYATDDDVFQKHKYFGNTNMQFNTEMRQSCHGNTEIEKKKCLTKSSITSQYFGHTFNNYLSRLFSSDHDAEQHEEETNGADGDSPVCPQRTRIPPRSITAFLPRNARVVDISNSKLGLPIPELYFDMDNRVTTVNASKSLMYCWDGPVHGLFHLEYLDLSMNLCKKVRMSFFDHVPNLKTLSIANNLLANTIHTDINGRLLRNLKTLEHLDMSKNHIVKVPRRFLIHQRNLLSLNVSYNNLVDFEIQVDQFVHLRSLDLRHNYINTLSKEMRSNISTISENVHTATMTTFTLSLVHNNLQCFCNNLEFLGWVHDHMSTCRFLNISISHCIYYNNTRINVTNRAELGAVINDLNNICKSYTTLIAASSVAFCVLIITFVSVVGYRFRWKLTYWYYVKAHEHPKSESGYVSIESLGSFNSHYKFDIYISSIENTRYFVLESMKKILEDNHFRVFIQDDDIIPGQNIYSIIGNAIHLSRIVIFIVSELCDDNREWMVAMRMAHEESLNRGYPVFFGVFFGDSSNRYDSEDIQEIKRRTYLTYPDNTQPINEQTFWHDLIRNIREIGGIQVLSMSEENDPTAEQVEGQPTECNQNQA